MNKLLKDAIADAKAVRETALAQAKLALEEAFAPKLQSMLSNKIKEEMEEEPKDDDYSMGDEGMRMKELAGLYEKGEDMEDMEDMEGGDDMGGEDEEFSSDDDFGGEEEMDFSSEDEMDGEEKFSGEDDEIEEILRQLEEEDMKDDDMEDEAMTMEMADDSEDTKMDEEINLDELIQALREGDDEEEKDEMNEGDDEYSKAGDQAMDASKGDHGDVVAERKKMKKMNKMEEDLNEAYEAVKFLREKLSEVNLLNAKLLYVNKLFRKNGLSEVQKVKIIETFDRAKNVRETKLIYATLSESIMTTTKSKKPVVENFASAPVKKTQVITEGNKQANRFKTLAGIIKS
jgi:hypothetical protein